MIKFIAGDFFDIEADIMVNTVNCVGVMGAGVALAFRRKFPDMFVDYLEQCKTGEIRPGRPAVWTSRGALTKKLEIVNFPTKNDWRKPSQYSYIEEGLAWMRRYLNDKNGKVVTLPALGCGHGGLEWERVRCMIVDALHDSPADIYVFEPSSSRSAGKRKIVDYDVIETAGIGVLKGSSEEYPEALGLYTKRDLFYFPSDSRLLKYDFSLVCSTKPSGEEANLIMRFVDLCRMHNKSLLLGASAFEKKLAVKLALEGVECACVLPSGIYDAVKRIKLNSPGKSPKLFSQGDPLKSFDRKEFLPAVMLRILLGRKCIFLTERLSWLSRFSQFLSGDRIDFFYYSWQGMPEDDRHAVERIKAKEIGPEFFEVAFRQDDFSECAA